ncbi:RHS repeat domain-containing protein [Paenibacillus durus]|uniref:Uncharacterized protein n=1 Tax=Paenibacillus durus TaxID=44251 RepID=A0A089HRR8_PAEDU|nr:RHS repeat-associated core domain-containing protein [Paenibacillus durus]AIQ13787.1 hypothetical protein PDUR_19095 [Paenibacillus durus]
MSVTLSGQYEDEEMGLYYNRFRYYSPHEGMYTQQDPIGLAGNNPTLYGYVHDPLTWIDPFGLSSTLLNKALQGIVGDKMQAHHIIPEEIWKANSGFFKQIGLGGKMDEAFNGILLPDSYKSAKAKGMDIIHSGSHPQYSDIVRSRALRIRQQFNMGIIVFLLKHNAAKLAGLPVRKLPDIMTVF